MISDCINTNFGNKSKHEIYAFYLFFSLSLVIPFVQQYFHPAKKYKRNVRRYSDNDEVS